MAENGNFQPNSYLRESPLKRVLQTYLVAPILKKYLCTSVRVLWKDNNADHNNLYETRKHMEQALQEIDNVAFILNCITAMKTSSGEMKFGFAFWVAFDFAAAQCSKMEEFVIKKLLACGVDVNQVSSIKPRGKKILYSRNESFK